MKKIKIFKNCEKFCINPDGSTYIEGTWACYEAEAFINREDIKVLDIHYSGGKDDGIMIIYEEIK